MRIAFAQIVMAESMAGNLSAIVGAIREAASREANLVVFPECALTGYHPGMGDDLTPDNVENALESLGAECRRLKVACVMGAPFYGLGPECKPWNAAVVIDSNGTLVGAFPKVIFTQDELRQDLFSVGHIDTRTTFELEGIPCAVLVCIEFAGQVGDFQTDHCRTILGGLGRAPKIVFVLGVMDMGPESKAPPFSQEVAKEFDAYIVVVNVSHWGFGTPHGHLGGSLVVSPKGEVLVRAPYDEASVSTVDILNP